jgi:HK97 family phage major capsid protein
MVFDRLNLQDVQERRAELLDEMEAITALAKSENRDIDGDEATRIDKLMALHDELDADEVRAKRFQEAKLQAARRRTEEPPHEPPAKPVSTAPTKVWATAAEPCKLRAFTDQEDAYKVGRWLSAVCMKDPDSRQYCKETGIDMQYRREDGQVIRMDAQTVDDDSRGGYLVPAPLAAAILAVRDRFGVARRVSRIIPMASETLSIPKRAGGLTVYSPAEGAAITTSEATWSQVSLSTTDRFTLTRVSRKLLRSALVSVADQVAMEIGQAFGEGLDNEWCNGDGTGTYLGETGVRSAVGAAGVNTMATTSGDTWAETALADFTNTAALLPERFHNENTSWVCSRAYYTSVIERLMIAAGGTTTANIAAGGTPSLLGYPIYFSEKMPTSTAVSTIQAVLGDFYNGVIIGERQGIEIGMSEHRYFDSDEIGIRGKISYDLNVHGGGDGSNAEAYVALKTGAAS